ncbi:uncharacterized protein LOC129004456 [Macrosteles quadrilineatus]|uniref:uncharacterized protein LOC129004456 n=2 Tax=Macrosteles quadrilineatus TaxID=74068 RepID=UPI0023E0C75A|nr:uncharacterized protein LOC129004456 [Macrosteles quadrilineatus]
MGRILTVALGSLLILQTSVLVTSAKVQGNVVKTNDHRGAKQIFTSWITPEDKASSKDLEIELVPGKKLRVECVEYKSDDARAFIYSHEGVLIDTLNLSSQLDAPCSQLENYIHVTDNDFTKNSDARRFNGVFTFDLTMTYLIAGAKPGCVESEYDVTSYYFMARVDKKRYKKLKECPEKFASEVEKGAAAGGIVNLGPTGSVNMMHFNKDVAPTSQPEKKVFVFDTKTLKNKSFKLICEEYTLNNELPMTKRTTMATGWIVYEVDENVVLDKFLLDSCESGTQGININLGYEGPNRYFRIVYKRTDGKCFEKDIIQEKFMRLHYYDEVMIERHGPYPVRCPRAWTGDVGLNIGVAWWKLPFHKPLPYMTPQSNVQE